MLHGKERDMSQAEAGQRGEQSGGTLHRLQTPWKEREGEIEREKKWKGKVG